MQISGEQTTGAVASLDATNDTNRWYAVCVKQRAESVSTTCLQYKGYRYLAPTQLVKKKLSDRTKIVERPLFPGYLFCRLNVNDRLPVLITPGVLSIVSLGKEPAPIPEHEIDAI